VIISITPSFILIIDTFSAAVFQILPLSLLIVDINLFVIELILFSRLQLRIIVLYFTCLIAFILNLIKFAYNGGKVDGALETRINHQSYKEQ